MASMSTPSAPPRFPPVFPLPLKGERGISGNQEAGKPRFGKFRGISGISGSVSFDDLPMACQEPLALRGGIQSLELIDPRPPGNRFAHARETATGGRGEEILPTSRPVIAQVSHAQKKPPFSKQSNCPLTIQHGEDAALAQDAPASRPSCFAACR